MPSAAELLGKLVTRLKLPLTEDVAFLRSKNAERFLSGETLPPEIAVKVLQALAQALTRHAYIPLDGWPDSIGFPWPALLVELALRNFRHRCDQAFIRLRGGGLRRETIDFVMPTLARLVTIDLATRAGAWMCLVKSPAINMEKAPPLPTVAGVVDGLLSETVLTAPKFAAEVGVWRPTIDRWRAGSHPTEETLLHVSDFLASRRAGATVESIHQELRRALALAETLQDLRRTPSLRREIEDVWQAFWFLATRVAMRLGAVDEEVRVRALTSLIVAGSMHPAMAPLLEHLRHDSSPAWKADLLASADWAGRLYYAAQVGFSNAAMKERADLPAGLSPELIDSIGHHVLSVPTMDVQTIPEGWHTLVIKNPPEVAAENRRVQASYARAHGDHETAIAHLRRAVELVPSHADAHYELAVNLWMSGSYAEAIRECRRAVELRPGWELPQVEIGIVQLNAGSHEEARRHLELLLASSDAPSTHLLHNLATARSKCGDLAGALELFEHVIRDETYEFYPRSLSQAAHCAFTLGDHPRGMELAKRANDLGEAEAYLAWRAGAYRVRAP